MLDHPDSVSNNLVKSTVLVPINPNHASFASISSIEISVFVSISHAALYTSNASGKLLTFLNLFVLFSLFLVFA